MKAKIYGKRWFQKTYGNTYHSVTILINNEVYYQGCSYGYGNQYIETAKQLLKAAGYDLNKIEFENHVKDVNRKKDLYKEIF